MATNSLKWDPNNFLPTLLNKTQPLLDRTHTPRGARKAITLERNWDKEPWMHTRTNMESFKADSFAI
jgi:hypothetical protein